VAEPEFVQVTRAFYDNVASYATRFGGELAAWPLHRALLAGFAELVRAAGPAPIADIGCGPGSVTAHLNDMGSTAFGMDLSPHMVAQARGGQAELQVSRQGRHADGRLPRTRPGMNNTTMPVPCSVSSTVRAHSGGRRHRMSLLSAQLYCHGDFSSAGAGWLARRRWMSITSATRTAVQARIGLHEV
jgi:SAM-dependent methyltransferase